MGASKHSVILAELTFCSLARWGTAETLSHCSEAWDMHIPLRYSKETWISGRAQKF